MLNDTRLETMLDELRLNETKEFQSSYSFSMRVELDYGRGLYAMIPTEINDVLISELEIGCVYYGFVDIYNTSFVFECATFKFTVREEIDELPGPSWPGGQRTTYTCEIDYDSLKRVRHVLPIHVFNKAKYANRLGDVLHDVTSFLKAEMWDSL